MAGKRRRSVVPVQWEDAPEVREIARRLIEDHHQHLQGQPLNYLFRSTAAKGKGGASRKYRIVAKGALDVALSADPRWQGHSRFYVLEFPKTLWHRWSDDEKAANVDLCLTQLITSQSGAIQVIELQLADYGRVIGRHGLFEEDLVRLAKAINAQATLDLDDAVPGEAPGDAPADDSVPEYRADTTEILDGLSGRQRLEVVEGGESSGDAAAAAQPAEAAELVGAR